MIQLGVNIDHVATVRQARRGVEPNPAWAAAEAQLGGADGITVHLREDRRHIQDADLHHLRRLCQVRLNLEMAATDEMVEIARTIRPDTAMLVPEGRNEITTEGGLHVAGDIPRLRGIVESLRSSGMLVSAFIDADLRQVDAAHACGFDVCEVHTGPFAHAFADHGCDSLQPPVAAEVQRIGTAGRLIREAGMRFNAGHALNYANVAPIAALPGLYELHIGHAIVSRAIFTGLREAVREMKRLMREAAANAAISGHAAH